MARIADLQSAEDGSKPFGSTIYGLLTERQMYLPLKETEKGSTPLQPTNNVAVV